jgi:DnaJ-class molecular chaperone
VTLGSWLACPPCDGQGAHYREATCEDDVRTCRLCGGACEIELPLPLPGSWEAREVAEDCGLIGFVDDDEMKGAA